MSRFQETRKDLVKESARHHHKEPNTKLIFPGNFLEKSRYPEIFVYDEFGYESDDDSYIFYTTPWSLLPVFMQLSEYVSKWLMNNDSLLLGLKLQNILYISTKVDATCNRY